MSVVLFVVGLTAAIMLHEAGHFVVARRCGMRASRFFLGFGPTLWSFRRGETEYGVKALPLGGFVQLVGMPGERGPFLSSVGADEFADGSGIADAEGRLRRALDRRGAPGDVVDAVVAAAGVGGAVSEADAARRVDEAVGRVVEDDGRGRRGLRHRLLLGDDGRLFRDVSHGARAATLAAGPGMNVVQAVVLLFAALWVLGTPAGAVAVGGVEPGSPADVAGVRVGDEIAAVDGRPAAFAGFRDVARGAMADGRVALTVRRDGAVVELPAADVPAGTLGVSFTGTDVARSPVRAAIGVVSGPSSFPSMVASTFEAITAGVGQGMARLPSQVTGANDRDERSVVGLIGIGQGFVAQADALGLWAALFTLAFLNLVLALMNLLPVPPLDGGHLAVVGVESAVNAVRRATGRAATFAVPHAAIATVALVAVVVMVALFAATTWLDLVNPVAITS